MPAASATRQRTLVVPDSVLLASDDGNWGFGQQLVIDEPHGHVIIGQIEKFHDFGGGEVYSGAVYVVDHATGALVQEVLPTNVADQTNGASFGIGIAQDGDWLLVGVSGTNVTYFFEWTGSAYTYRQRLAGSTTAPGDYFGCSVAIDGEYAAVGASCDDDAGTCSGTVFVFQRTGGVWAQTQAIPAPVAQTYQFFGSKVRLSGSHLAIAANQFYGTYNDEGRVWVYEESGGTFGSAQALTAGVHAAVTLMMGDSMDLSGDYLAVGHRGHDSGRGAVSIFKLSVGTWSEIQFVECPDTPDTNAGFGWGNTTTGSVALSSTNLLVGARGWYDPLNNPGGWVGGAFLFERDDADTYQLLAVGAAGGNPIYPAAKAEFGASVAMSSDGTIAISGYSEYGDWATNNALPEGPPPDYSYCGTVRIYRYVDPELVTAVSVPESTAVAVIGWHGGSVVTLTAAFTIGTDYLVYLGKSESSDDEPCYGGVHGQGYSVQSTDGLALQFVAPRLTLSDLGECVVTVYEDGSNVFYGHITVVEETFSNELFETRTRWPDHYEVGPRSLPLEEDQ